MADGRLVRVSLPYGAVAGLIVRGGVVVEAAPILRWTLGLREDVAAARLRRKGAILEPLDPRGY
jgi:hypothetical protein